VSAAVKAVGQTKPAVSVAFSSIEFGAQDSSLFTFAAPAGSTVTEKTITAADVTAGFDASPSSPVTAPGERPTVIGTGWSTIVSLPANLAGMASTNSGDASQGGQQDEALRMLDQLTTQVAGGRVLETSLFSIFFTDDGRMLAGAVGPDALVAAASR